MLVLAATPVDFSNAKKSIFELLVTNVGQLELDSSMLTSALRYAAQA